MQFIKYISVSIVSSLLFMQCSSAQKFQKKAPVDLDNGYCQRWVSGVQGGGSGLNLFLPTTVSTYDHIRLDSVYFRGKVVKLEVVESNGAMTYIGRFKTEFNMPNNVILSSDMKAESKNTLSMQEPVIPFELKDNECVISYKKGLRTQYYKIDNIEERSPLNYPSAAPNKQ
ncbi:hypothetical protein A9Q86_13545 [Flavobacteriales bacterium 33_180_T64]|nr:hypothetical protein A9Q86_13545 [Flavobacteriales bacterium 33_180_T64]